LTELTREDIATLCAAGAMAPSGGNAQPWRVTVTGDRMCVDVRDESGDFLDVGGYAALIAIGAFSENVAVTAPSIGLAFTREVRDGAVHFRFTGRQSAAAPELHECVARRVTNRRPSDGTLLDDATIGRLTRVAQDGALTMSAVSDQAGKATVASALALADAVRMRHRTMFDDMMNEMRWSPAQTAATNDGMDIRTLELPTSTEKLLSVLRRAPWLRTLLPTARLGDTARALVAGCSHICCLSTSAEPTRDTLVTTGMALQQLWLTATRDGVALHPWTVGTLELIRLERFAGKGFSEREKDTVARVGVAFRAGFDLPVDRLPLFVFRLSRAPQARARSLRLPWQSFTEVVGDDG
jgi:nitroreductase